MSQLAQRVLTAILLLIGLLLILFVAPLWVAIWATTTVIVIAAWEWSAFLGWRLPQWRGVYAGGMALLLAATGWLVPAVVALPVILWMALLWWAVAFFWILRYPTTVPPLIAACAGVLVLIPSWLAMVAILRVPEHGPALLLLALCIVFSADIGAYFAGHRFGRVKLAPQVSPGKTWEGFIGGVLMSALTAGAGGALLNLPPGIMVPVGLGIGAVSVVGDLTESLFKRSVGVKDSGTLIPGHGGVLDRIDSITAAMPLFALVLSWLGLPTG